MPGSKWFCFLEEGVIKELFWYGKKKKGESEVKISNPCTKPLGILKDFSPAIHYYDLKGFRTFTERLTYLSTVSVAVILF